MQAGEHRLYKIKRFENIDILSCCHESSNYNLHMYHIQELESNIYQLPLSKTENNILPRLASFGEICPSRKWTIFMQLKYLFQSFQYSLIHLQHQPVKRTTMINIISIYMCFLVFILSMVNIAIKLYVCIYFKRVTSNQI